MILACRAQYDAHTDSVQVAAIVQDDSGVSLTASVQSGTVEILDGNTTMFSESFSATHRVVQYDADENTITDKGNFYFFLHHPPIQRNLSARITVNLTGGITAAQKVDIEVNRDPEPNAWQNPALSGREAGVFVKDPSFP